MIPRGVGPELRLGGVFRKVSQAEESADRGEGGMQDGQGFFPLTHTHLHEHHHRQKGKELPGQAQITWPSCPAGPSVSHLTSGEPGVP